METIFFKLLEMSFSASVLILILVLLRPLLKKAPKSFGCFLWALVAVRLICPFSIQSPFSLGSAGSLDSSATSGKFVIPTESYREEGLSYNYAAPADYITIKKANTVKAIFDELKLPSVQGKVWTTDAIYRETQAKLVARKAEGCIAVEMELAGVQAVCDFYGWDLYDFLVTGDVLDQAVYDVSGLADANHNMDKLYIAIEIAKRI